MDPVERLAAYLAGELDADERAAIEASLARDPALRSTLAALERADAALARLSGPAPPPGFEERLAAVLDAELATRLHGAPDTASQQEPTTGPAAVTGADELAARRARRQARPGPRRRWVPALGGVAAAAVLLAAGIGIVGLPERAGHDDMVAMDAMELEAHDDGIAAGPVVLVGDRPVDAAALDELLADPLVAGLASESLDPAAGGEVAAAFTSELLALGDPVPAPAAPDEPTEDAAEELGVPDGLDPAPEAETRALAVDEAAIARCLPEVLDASPGAIPTYVELARYEGGFDVVLGLVTVDPATGRYTRTEVWVLDRADCQVRRFVQR